MNRQNLKLAFALVALCLTSIAIWTGWSSIAGVCGFIAGTHSAALYLHRA
jgi:hypothetical protein